MGYIWGYNPRIVSPFAKFLVPNSIIKLFGIYIPGTCDFGLYFGGWTLQNKAFSNQNKSHLGSRSSLNHTLKSS